LTEGAKGGARGCLSPPRGTGLDILLRAMLYDRPVRELLQEAIQHQASPFSRKDVQAYFGDRYPLVKQSTISAHVVSATVNDRNRRHYAPAGDLLFRNADGVLEHYHPARHGKWSANGDPEDDVANALAEGRPAYRSRTRRTPTRDFLGVDIERNVATYLGDRSSTARYASFDYCFNYFQGWRERNEVSDLAEKDNLELSCLHLGFYLASWGMLRASTVLFRKSVRYLTPVVQTIAALPAEIWTIDANAYSDESIDSTLDVRDRLWSAFDHDASATLVSKVMLGVFGSVPAFDSYVMKGLGVRRFGKPELELVRDFYRGNDSIIDRLRAPTLDFTTGTATDRLYTRAKVVDMVFFIEGGGTAEDPAGAEGEP
jgi:hypothetical protein